MKAKQPEHCEFWRQARVRKRDRADQRAHCLLGQNRRVPFADQTGRESNSVAEYRRYRMEGRAARRSCAVVEERRERERKGSRVMIRDQDPHKPALGISHEERVGLVMREIKNNLRRLDATPAHLRDKNFWAAWKSELIRTPSHYRDSVWDQLVAMIPELPPGGVDRA